MPVAKPLVGVCGVDTATKLSAASAGRLAAASVPVPVAGGVAPIRFVTRYVSLGPASPGDLDAAETAAILGAGLALVVVQHVRYPGWAASGQLGAVDGQHAALNAEEAGYPGNLTPDEPTLSLVCDLEGVANTGAPVAEYVDAWCLAVAGAGYTPVLYVGYKCGLTPAELYSLPHVSRYWCDAGPRSVAVRGFCAKQHPQVTIAGVLVDPDYAYTDALGGTLVGLSGDSVARDTDPAPASGPDEAA
jgi:hypothetical protein